MKTTCHRTAAADWAVAVHEAGHAVVGLVLGAEVGEATIDPSGGDEGSVQVWGATGFNFLCVLLAGGEAEAMFAVPHASADGDMAIAERSGLLGDGAARFEAGRYTRQMLRHNEPAVRAVALALVRRRTMAGWEVREAAFGNRGRW